MLQFWTAEFRRFLTFPVTAQLFGLGILLLGCGPRGVDPELAPYVEEFYGLVDEAGLEGRRDVPVHFTEDSRVLGKCVDGEYVEISRKRWPERDVIRQWLVFHELSHCALRLGHEAPGHYMNTGLYIAESSEKLRARVLEHLRAHKQ